MLFQGHILYSVMDSIDARKLTFFSSRQKFVFIYNCGLLKKNKVKLSLETIDSIHKVLYIYIFE